MKVQDLLYPYLIEHKRMSFPGIGIFTTSGSVQTTQEEDGFIAGNTIQFTADKTAALEESLLLFLKERTGKMKALAQSDLDSFINNGIQLLNIGKPFDIPGIGVVQKSSEGIVSFQEGTAVPEQFLTDQTKKLVDHNDKESNRKYSTDRSNSGNHSSKKKMILYVGGILIIAILTWIIYLQFSSDDKKKPDQAVTPATNAEIPVNETPPLITEDSINNKKDSIKENNVIGFEMIGQYPANMDTIRKFYKLYSGRGHQVRIDSSVPATPRLLFVFKRPIKDTSYVSDSMRIWYRIRTKYFGPLNQ